MTLKGEWSGDTAYSQGDVMRYSNGTFYVCVKDCKAGTPCADALYFNPLPSPLCECAKMIMDSQASLTTAIQTVAGTIPTNIDDDSIVLKSGDNEYMVSVDATGDTPELAVELIEAPEEEAET